MDFDSNGNSKIDDDDPATLYVSGIHGEGLKALTPQNENVVDIDIYEKHNFALIKVQRDFNKDGNFNSKDADYYYMKIDLATLAFGKKIELR